MPKRNHKAAQPNIAAQDFREGTLLGEDVEDDPMMHATEGSTLAPSA